jgi:hypothetical protein
MYPITARWEKTNPEEDEGATKAGKRRQSHLILPGASDVGGG